MRARSGRTPSPRFALAKSGGASLFGCSGSVRSSLRGVAAIFLPSRRRRRHLLGRRRDAGADSRSSPPPARPPGCSSSPPPTSVFAPCPRLCRPSHHRDEHPSCHKPALRDDRVAARPELRGPLGDLHFGADRPRRLPPVLRLAPAGGPSVSNHVEGKPIKTSTHSGLSRPPVAFGIDASLSDDLRPPDSSRPAKPVGPFSSRDCGVGQVRAINSKLSRTGPTRPAAPPLVAPVALGRGSRPGRLPRHLPAEKPVGRDVRVRARPVLPVPRSRSRPGRLRSDRGVREGIRRASSFRPTCRRA